MSRELETCEGCGRVFPESEAGGTVEIGGGGAALVCTACARRVMWEGPRRAEVGPLTKRCEYGRRHRERAEAFLGLRARDEAREVLTRQHEFFGGPLAGLRDERARGVLFDTRACVEALLTPSGNVYATPGGKRRGAELPAPRYPVWS